MAKWAGPGRITASTSRQDRLAELQAQARKVLGSLETQVRLGGVWQGYKRVKLSDGVEVMAHIDATYPDSPLVRAQIVSSPVADELSKAKDRWDIYAIRRSSIASGDPNQTDLSEVTVMSAFTYVNKKLFHNWEYIFGTKLHGTAVLGTRFYIDPVAKDSTFIGKSSAFHPPVPGYFSCFFAAQRYITSILRSETVRPTGAYLELGTGIVPFGVYEGGEEVPCSGRFTLGSDQVTTPIADFGAAWEGTGNGFGMAKDAEGNLLFFDQMGNRNPDADPDGEFLSAFRVGASRELLFDIYSGTPRANIVGTAQARPGGVCVAAISNDFGVGELKFLVYDPATGFRNMVSGTGIPFIEGVNNGLMTLHGPNVYVAGNWRESGSDFRMQVYRYNLNTGVSEMLIDAGPTGAPDTSGAAAFGGISVLDGGRTLLIFNTSDWPARTQVAWLYTYNPEDGYVLSDTVFAPFVEESTATAGMDAAAGFGHAQTIHYSR